MTFLLFMLGEKVNFGEEFVDASSALAYPGH